VSAWRTTLRRFLPRRFLRSGTLHSLHDVWSPQLGNRRDVTVYLPPTYGGARRFPTVYVQDGQNLFDPKTAHAGDWGLLPALDALAAKARETIIVGVWNLGEARLAEYSPFRDEKTGGGRGDLYLAFLTETLKPMIDRRFRTRPEREHTGIAGSSMGGLISLYGFFRAPAAFGFAAALSPSLWFADGAIFPSVASAPVVPGRIYLDVGRHEGEPHVSNVHRLHDLLIAKGYRAGRDVHVVDDPHGGHDEASWGRRFPPALSCLLSEGGAR
jgi:predicted alpha/beta superfamily hydrolase